MKQPRPAPPEWAELIPIYLAWSTAKGNTRDTAKLHDYHLRRVATEIGCHPFSVTLDTLSDYLGSKDWSRSTRNSYRSTLRSFYTWAVATERITTSPAAALPKPRVDAGRKREPASDIAVAWGLRAADPRVRLMVKIGARCAMRPGEIARVHSNDVFRDFVGWSLVVQGKGKKQRVVPLTDDLAMEIRAANGYLFPGKIDGHLSEGYVSKLISWAMPDGQTGHMLRHRRASKAYQETGHDIRAVQELLGHASVATTQVYVPIAADQLRRAVGGEL